MLDLCAHPLFRSWATLIGSLYNSYCNSLFATQLESCHTIALELSSCASGNGSVALGLLASFSLSILVLVILVGGFVSWIHRWLTVQEGSANLAIASAALEQLRESVPLHHPPTKHFWISMPGAELTLPLFCSVCHESIQGFTPGSTFSACAVCGVAAHTGSCSRHAGDTCRPICLLVSPAQQPHFWVPEGAVYQVEGLHTSAESVPCVYCGDEKNEGELFAAEPNWRCSCCDARAHVECFCLAHLELRSLSEKYNGAFIAPELQHITGVEGGSSDDDELDLIHENAARLRKTRRRQKVISSRNVSVADTCSLGSYRSLTLPSSCVRKGSKELPSSGGSNSSLAEAANYSTGNGNGRQKQPSRRKSKKRLSNGKSWWTKPFQRTTVHWSEFRLSVEEIPTGIKPILVFINVKSGPCVGSNLRNQFLRRLHPLQVVTLPKDRPEPALLLFSHVKGLRILVAGGDGTVGWILSCLDALSDKNPDWVPPPVAILPLGTGNDLARCLGWGGGLGGWGSGGIGGVLSELEGASVTLLDRWTVLFSDDDDSSVSVTSAPSNKKKNKTMNNYLGIGVDARVALQFHTMREQYPTWFQSQVGNKICYAGVGAKDILAGVGNTSNWNGQGALAGSLTVTCDGREIGVPGDVDGILIINIPSYMGGVDLWGSGHDHYQDEDGDGGECRGRGSTKKKRAQSMCDGWLEIVAVYGSWHLGRLQVGLSRATRLTQAQEVCIKTTSALPMQIDGEPFLQQSTMVTIQMKGQALMLSRTESGPAARVSRAAVDALDWAREERVITAAQHQVICKELAKRMHPLIAT